MDVENVIERKINLGVTFIDLDKVELNIPCVKSEEFKHRFQNLFVKLKDEQNASSRTETFDEVRSIINFFQASF